MKPQEVARIEEGEEAGTHEKPATKTPEDGKYETHLNAKYRAYCLLYDCMMQKDRILRHLNLPKYRVPWIRMP
jgi:hypothetical protein